jgi:hypothetical protein
VGSLYAGKEINGFSPSFAHDIKDMLEPVLDEIIKASLFSWRKQLPMEFVQTTESLGNTVNGFLSAVPTALSDANLRGSSRWTRQWSSGPMG